MLHSILIGLGSLLGVYTMVGVIRGRVTAYGWFPFSLALTIWAAIFEGMDGDLPGITPIERVERWFWFACLFNWIVSGLLIEWGLAELGYRA